MSTVDVAGLEITGPEVQRSEEVLTPEALELVAMLHRETDGRRRELLARREERQRELDAGGTLDFLEETREVREGDWTVSPPPPALRKRWVEITGPTSAKMVINALNSGSTGFMADFEDANSPTWANMVGGQANLMDAIRETLEFHDQETGKEYRLDEETATLLVRPRGWHLVERHVEVDGEPVAGGLFDFGLYMHHNAQALLERGSGPFFYLPKMESHLEARMWNDAFNLAEDHLGLDRGTARGTVLIETLPAAFEMDEILYELREHSAGLNAGRWDYIFSIIKKFRSRSDMILPDRVSVTMTVPFMRAYTELLVQTCHRRGAHAMGGMSAFIPSRRDPEVNDKALAAVRADKQRESADGFDGTWVAHPDLIPVAREIFDAVLGDMPNQKDRLRPEVRVTPRDLIDVAVPDGHVTEAGVRANVSIGLSYLASWLAGNGAAAINNLMEDAATAEISRSQLWQWRTHAVPLEDGSPMTAERYTKVRDEELATLQSSLPDFPWTDAAALLDELVLSDDFAEFLTLSAYARLA